MCWDASTYDSKGNVTAHVATPLEELPLVGVNVLMGLSPFGLRGRLRGLAGCGCEVHFVPASAGRYGWQRLAVVPGHLPHQLLHVHRGTG